MLPRPRTAHPRSFSNHSLRICLASLASLVLALGALGAQVVYEQVHSFGLGADSAAYPAAPPLIGMDGRLYGTTLRGGSSDAGTVYRVEADGTGFTVLHSFLETEAKGPLGVLAQDTAGVLYGVAGGFEDTGGVSASGRGIVFRINADGSGFAIIKAFAENGTEGSGPAGGLALASNGMLYGTTFEGGTYNGGTVFSLATDGSEFSILREFGESAEDGRNPRCFLIEGADGLLYGTTRRGGAAGGGTVFRMTKFIFGYEVLKSFVPATEGQEPLAGVVEGRDGRLYGTLSQGRTGWSGAAYAINPDGTGFALLHSFLPPEGSTLYAGICQATDGMLYTIAAAGGSNGAGTVVRFREDGTDFAKIRDLGAQQGEPSTGLASPVEIPNGRICFATLAGGASGAGALASILKDGKDMRVAVDFSRSGSEAIMPRGEVVALADGFLYGTSSAGGSGGRGALFKIRPDGSGYAILRNFGETSSDAALPAAGVATASDGRLFGTTTGGGAAGRGALFRVRPDGTDYSVIYSFRGAPTDGAAPTARLIEGDDGLLYGVTSAGGASNLGTVFRIRKDGGGYAVLRSLSGSPADGANPYGGLLQTRSGVLYGVTYYGGSGNAGTVFRLNPDGSGYAVLRSFSMVSPSPANPWGALIEGSDGRLYGTSVYGGGGGGTVFSLASGGGDLRVLVALPQATVGGLYPSGRLLQDSSGRLWGTCWQGGSLSMGTVFSLSSDGSAYETVHAFAGSPSEGALPIGGLSMFANGILYGMTTGGGAINRGSLFRVTLDTAVRIERISKEVGGPAAVQIKATPGWRCSLESSTALQPSAWTEVANGRADAAGMLMLIDVNASGQPTTFYRALATP